MDYETYLARQVESQYEECICDNNPCTCAEDEEIRLDDIGDQMIEAEYEQ